MIHTYDIFHLGPYLGPSNMNLLARLITASALLPLCLGDAANHQLHGQVAAPYVRVGSADSSGEIRDEAASFCPFDRIAVEWFLPDVPINAEDAVWVGLHDASSSSSPSPLSPPMHRWHGAAMLGVARSPEEETERWRALHVPAAAAIHCDVGGPSCTVGVESLGYDPATARIEVNFDRPTNAPLLDGGAANPLAGVLELAPLPRVFASAPFWETPAKLVVPVDLPADQSAVLAAFHAAQASATVAAAPQAQAPSREAAEADVFAAPESPTAVAARGGAVTGAGDGVVVGGGGGGGGRVSGWPMRGFFTLRLGDAGRAYRLALWTGAATATRVSGSGGATDGASGGATGRGPVALSAVFVVGSCADGGSLSEVVLQGLAPPHAQTSSFVDSSATGSAPEHDEAASAAATAAAAAAAAAAEVNPTPFWDPKGVFALTGRRPLVLPTSALPGRGAASWSLSFWVWLAEPPTGHFRTLFFKGVGDGGDPGRTPSAWLHPDSGRLALRASMGPSHPDLGADTVAEVPTRAWTHLTFTFTNRTKAAAAASTAADDNGGGGGGDNDLEPFSFGFFVDGVHDVTINYPHAVDGNLGDLRIGKDPDRAGPKCLVAHPKLWWVMRDSI